MCIKWYFKYFFGVILILGSSGATAQVENKDTVNVKIAFLADVHFQDIYGQFSDSEYKGILNPGTGKYTTLRTMNAQLHSTRIFNENYFGFLAALNDVAKRGIKLVALPGDFSDDGQPVHVKGLQKILQNYTDRYNIQFFAITGNHDPVRPFAKEGIKKDFLGEDGKNQIVASMPMEINSSSITDLPAKVSRDIQEMGYEGIVEILSHFGFYPKANYLYWETPFSKFNYDTYSFETAMDSASLRYRRYPIPTTTLNVPDASYLVEPVEGLWLMALDGNVYLPKDSLSGMADNPSDFNGAGMGYNLVLTHKPHLLDWVRKVTTEAQKRNKLLVAFSHYPMVEFNDGSSAAMRSFFGANKMQLARVPSEEVAKAFLKAGLKIHFGGHMHINDTGVFTAENGETLFNIQVPSLAAYLPAYKILTVHDANQVEIETIPLTHVPHFDELFPLYKMEYVQLTSLGDKVLWDKAILNTTAYDAFVQFHLKELVRLRFIPEDWPTEFADYLMAYTGTQLLEETFENLKKSELKKELKNRGMRLQSFQKWTGFDMIYDYYRLRGADELAIPVIGNERVAQYVYLAERMALSNDAMAQLWAQIVTDATKTHPAAHFMIHLDKNQWYSLKQ
ncbi:metallophosphoesterase [Arenibacter sp. GZD96]|uniref:metallophosphoesterase n=1 Tax=Aurantibrevibacter litoralis TaxID=3106030 RepID=UPI002AFF63B3|nr:metallophosphoesterase [Arenibacter sp. GZD-96]MEA1784773.1 metallophosphoesterase [Arenibacter sp. GZD-96]